MPKYRCPKCNKVTIHNVMTDSHRSEIRCVICLNVAVINRGRLMAMLKQGWIER